MSGTKDLMTFTTILDEVSVAFMAINSIAASPECLTVELVIGPSWRVYYDLLVLALDIVIQHP